MLSVLSQEIVIANLTSGLTYEFKVIIIITMVQDFCIVHAIHNHVTL